MRKIICLLSIILVFSLVGCWASDPKNTVEDFIEMGKDFNLVTLKEYINPFLDKQDEIEKWCQYFETIDFYYQLNIYNYLKENAAKITYEIKSVVKEKERAVVTVDFNYVNGITILAESHQEIIEEMEAAILYGKGMNIGEIDSLFTNILEKYQMITLDSFRDKSVDLKLVKIDKQWYLDEISADLLDVFVSNLATSTIEVGTIVNLLTGVGEGYR